ncbi:MAG: N-acetyl-gamma-glutamyl-phosphate reductase [Spirochaetaceae bacterium]|jgi:N-acetyl-gamma-glutamyl-phosphate reductase|nr:N-acetyl-gamma-glutamyl-phosphate reductase [Spirochaetaceae bacterium]
MIAGVIGATGYAGSELIRLLSGHPEITRLLASSSSAEGEQLERVYPHFEHTISLTLTSAEKLIAQSDVVFSALPNGYAGELAQKAAGRCTPFIDLSADFRFDDDEETYTAWYGMPYKGGELHKKSVYGLPELNRAKITALAEKRKTEPLVIGNPGCYPTAISLAAFPALKQGIAGSGLIIADAVSGVSGAGRELARAYHFVECADSASLYKTGCHRHIPEISRNLHAMETRLHSEPFLQRPLIFTPRLVPMNRGILAAVYIPLSDNAQVALHHPAPRPPSAAIEDAAASIRALYADFYRGEPFVRVLPAGLLPATNRVRGSNYCDIAVSIAQTGQTLIVTSAIDNMVKGAAGQAIQNMNIIFGFDEKAGLSMPPVFF